MRPTKLTLFELFERQRRYVVPLYQRPYVWTQEKQWEPLWEDVTTKAGEVMERGRKTLPHFLGAVVLNRRDVFGREIDASDVIDGQQRLTTIQILLAAFRDQLPSESENLRRDVGHLVENTCTMESPNERFKVWPTNADQQVYEFVLCAGSKSAIEDRFPPKQGRRRLQQPRLVEAYSFFYDQIGSFLRGEDGLPAGPASPKARAEALFEAIRRNLQLVVIELEDEDDPQVIFETLNARGEPLLPSDLVRNFIFLRAARQRADANQLYDRWWREYDEAPAEDGEEPRRFWKREEKRGRLKRSRLDLFLHDHLQFRMEREVRIDHLYQEFRNWWTSGDAERAVEEELKQLRTYSDAYSKILVPDRQTRLGVFAHRLRSLDTTTVNPLLLFLLVEAKERIDAVDMPGILTDLESYLVRRLVCGLTTKNYNRFFTSLIKKLRGPAKLDRGSFRSQLGAEIGESVRWPEDKEFERAWQQQPAYLRIGAPRLEMILGAIDLQLQTSKQERLHISDSLTIEHVMPQEWREHWPAPPAPVDPPKQGDEEPEDRRDRLLHSFGNLTLLTQALNSSVSNGPFDVKRPEIARQSNLRLNAYFQEAKTWEEEQILRRGVALFETARAIWPHPGQPAAA